MRSRSVYTLVLAAGWLFVGASTAFAAAPQDRTWGEEIWPHALLSIYCVLIVAGSLAGGWLPSVIDLNHNRMQVVISFVGGLMLGIGVLHLLPHAVSELHGIDVAAGWMMVGMLVMFFLIRSFHVHHHGPLELPDVAGTVVEDSYRYKLQDAGATHAGHAGPCAHDHAHAGPAASGRGASRVSWLGIALGLSLHTLIDGVALGAAIRSDQGNGGGFALLGVGTFLAVLLHKPLDAVSITSLMAAGGWPASKRNAVNFGFALMCPLGAAVFVLGVDKFPGVQHEIVGAALAFAAGVFVCISLGDLLPEMEFHAHSRLRLSAALLLGIAAAWAIGFLEPIHVHPH
ncbi:MAG: ZIP family metal transporter [Planctomycetaceae bacterium]